MQTPHRRAKGELEQAVLEHLWLTDSSQTPGEVLAALDQSLAYTTVMTILTRLHAKGLVARQQQGRAYAYRPIRQEAGDSAQEMADLLTKTVDRYEALSRFIALLTPGDLEALREALRQAPSEPAPVPVRDPTSPHGLDVSGLRSTI